MTEINEKMAVDLGAVRENAEKREKLEREQAEALAQAQLIRQAVEFDRAMNRAFKGVVARPIRHGFMMRSADAA